MANRLASPNESSNLAVLDAASSEAAGIAVSVFGTSASFLTLGRSAGASALGGFDGGKHHESRGSQSDEGNHFPVIIRTGCDSFSKLYMSLTMCFLLLQMKVQIMNKGGCKWLGVWYNDIHRLADMLGEDLFIFVRPLYSSKHTFRLCGAALAYLTGVVLHCLKPCASGSWATVHPQP